MTSCPEHVPHSFCRWVPASVYHSVPIYTYTRTQFGAKVSVQLVQNLLRVETLHQPKALELADQIERMGIPAASMIISDILHTLVEEAHAVGDDEYDLCEFAQSQEKLATMIKARSYKSGRDHSISILKNATRKEKNASRSTAATNKRPAGLVKEVKDDGSGNLKKAREMKKEEADDEG